MRLMLRAPLLGRNFGGRCGEVAGLLDGRGRRFYRRGAPEARRRLAPAVRRAVQRSDPLKGGAEVHSWCAQRWNALMRGALGRERVKE